MTTTTTFQGMDPEAKSSSRVLQPPGGSSNITFGTGDGDQKQSLWPSKTATNIFGGPVDPHAGRRNNPPGEGRSLGIFGGSEEFPPNKKNIPATQPSSTAGESAPVVESAEKEKTDTANVEEHEYVPEEKEPSNSVGSNAAAPTAGGSSNRRNPPGGKSSLVLG
ncbi:jupiter microtubule associated homolog 1b [Polypterus senegalus]|uniref:jupiter microtubule associated homolog 1b n=1 Tax=Polypterus senegalus TaxID=55291 RepID=UPI0019634746|nr:jupiter microtubule associated homolog 1b [Polypterus senegalus]